MDEAPPFETISDHEELIAWSRSYARDARREWGLDTRFDLVEWEVSTRAKRRAAAVKRPVIDGATVGEPMDWEANPGPDGRPPECTVSLTWTAFEAFDRAEWQSTLRHELIHVEQFQRYGTTGHGAAFRERAEALDTEVHCRTFADPKWTFRCTDCGGVTAHRYRECKLVREYEQYRSNCCEAPIERESHGEGDGATDDVAAVEADAADGTAADDYRRN
ncbi:SprT-like domain-containing protein [Halomicrobium urmianum]|uniref:SprT-like domain-containing protein n=1 Tax=Halomicrobium urmianum TaxID=1586233 RepID=UPI0027E45BB1|nr:SprT-like domain-containing protein [Halomicrobium urmianum]